MQAKTATVGLLLLSKKEKKTLLGGTISVCEFEIGHSQVMNKGL